MGKGWGRLLFAGMVGLGVHGAILSLPMPEYKGVLPVLLPLECITLSLSVKNEGSNTSEKHEEKNEQGQELVQSPSLPPVPIPVLESSELLQPVFSSVKEEDGEFAPEPQVIPQERASLQHEVRGQTTTVPAPPVIHKAIPLYQVNPSPEYPRLARRRGLEGVVLLDVLVDLWGGVKELNIIYSSGYSILDKAALKAVIHWQFKAGGLDGQSQEMWVQVPVRFQLN